MTLENNNNTKEMGGSSPLTTGVDALIDLLKNSKEMTYSEAARRLGVPDSLVEGWARFLEESGDLNVNYKLTTPYMSISDNKKSQGHMTDSEPQKDVGFEQIHRFFTSIDNAYD